jgi:hypothetical protein
MADEISLGGTLSITKDGGTSALAIELSETLTGEGNWNNTQVIPEDSWELLAFPTDLTTEGITYLMLKNKSADYYVDIALDNAGTHKFARIQPGKFMILPPYQGNPTYYAKSVTADISLIMVAAGT